LLQKSISFIQCLQFIILSLYAIDERMKLYVNESQHFIQKYHFL